LPVVLHLPPVYAVCEHSHLMAISLLHHNSATYIIYQVKQNRQDKFHFF